MRLLKRYDATHVRSKFVGPAFEYHTRKVLQSAEIENLLGGPNPRPPRTIFLVDIPNFHHNQAVRLEELRRPDCNIVGSEMEIHGDGGVWMVQRDYLCAGSNWFRNHFTSTLAGATVGVSVKLKTDKSLPEFVWNVFRNVFV
jgi:hypothetical protein